MAHGVRGLAFAFEKLASYVFAKLYKEIDNLQENSDLMPLDENGLVKCKEVDYVDTWKSMEACVRKGLVRSIGVSNFNSQQLKRLMDHCAIKPVTNQVCYINISRETSNEAR